MIRFSNYRSSRSYRRVFAAIMVGFCTVTACTPQRAARPEGGAGLAALGDHKGKVVYLDFWASWCEPCKRSFPWMAAMHDRYEDEGLVIIAVNVDSDHQKAERFVATHAPDFRIVFDPDGTLAKAYQIEGMPSSFVYDRHGNLRGNHVGFRERDTGELEALIVTLLEEDPE